MLALLQLFATLLPSWYSEQHHAPWWRGCAETSCCLPARTYQGARHQILLHCILHHKTSVTQACHRALQINASLGVCVWQPSYQETSDVESVLHIYMFTLDDYSDAATLFRLCSDSLHCNSCTQNLYRTCMYVAVCINSTPQLGLRLNRLPLCMNTRLVHAAWTEKCASAGNHDWAPCFLAYITYNLSLSYATIESSGYFYNCFCHSTGKSYYMPSWLAMKFVSINAVLYTAHVIRRFISNAEVPDSKLDACTARLACFLS